MEKYLTRIAIVNPDLCDTNKCQRECKTVCPVNKTGKQCVTIIDRPDSGETSVST